MRWMICYLSLRIWLESFVKSEQGKWRMVSSSSVIKGFLRIDYKVPLSSGLGWRRESTRSLKLLSHVREINFRLFFKIASSSWFLVLS